MLAILSYIFNYINKRNRRAKILFYYSIGILVAMIGLICSVKQSKK